MGVLHAIHPALRAQEAFPELVPPETPAIDDRAGRPARPRAANAERKHPRLHPEVRVTTLSIDNFHLYGELFANYLKARHAVFINQKGWDLPSTRGMEFDQYDTPLSKAVIVHEYGTILAGIRLMPTTAECGQYSYMVRDAQRGLLENIPRDILFFEAPVKPEIWEATRLFVSPCVSSERRLTIQTLLIEQMATAAREAGARHVIGIVPAVFSRWMNRLGMNAIPVGPVLNIGGDRSQAALMDVRQARNHQINAS